VDRHIRLSLHYLDANLKHLG
jgi:hypothetical protein